MTARGWTRTALAATSCALGVAAVASSCGRGGTTEVLVLVENDPAAQMPDHLRLSWLKCGNLLLRERRVPETGPLTARANPIASIVVEVESAGEPERQILVKGMVGDESVSMGTASVWIAKGKRAEVTVRLVEGEELDADRDGKPDNTFQGCSAGADGGDEPPAWDAAGVDRRIEDGAPMGPPNKPPTVNAGPDATLLTVGAELMLAGSAADDGIGTLAVSWSKVSGPGDVTFTDAAAAATRARFAKPGDYVLRLSATDGAASSADDVTVSVLGLDVDLVGCWHFDEGAGVLAKDCSTGGNDASLVDGAAWSTGRIGASALAVPGDNDHARVRAAAGSRLDFGTGDFTVSVWVKTTQVTSMRWPSVVSRMAVSGAMRWGYEVLVVGTGTVRFQVWSGTTSAPNVHVDGANDGKWHHIAAVKTANELALYFDGREVMRSPHTLGSTTALAPLEFGGRAGAPINDFDGEIDEVRLYSRPLAPREIEALATGASP